ncbi:putative isoprenylcysteine alpha-carbonyl methylesterase ICMEL2 [Hypsizygus marmoreus]|uniref:Isoprenylcysteine alpha-carbonyl methylesterase ICMEL2 n=1 Tax=Hypsizygus marmoreus TaxID=39966 RepID=A0A369JGG6_HYPMA|nr:putative isoprenylcysteine alpha-carbonyl methylesterase ICMEL2 [Hypsizygus marmoreus]
MEFTSIPYTPSLVPDALREFDVYVPTPSPQGTLPPVLVFVHGGAWRSEDKADHSLLARKLSAATQFVVAVPNYRLTPAKLPSDVHFHHPGHAQDLLQFLVFLIAWNGPAGAGPLYDPNSLYLIGHSCSAHMITSIFLDSSLVSPSLTPPSTVFQAVKAVVMSEGIYDLSLLLSTFPAYREWFIAPTFGQHESYHQFSTTNFSLIDPHIRWLIIHSKGDTLVDLPQSEAMYKHLCNLYGDDAAARVRFNANQLDGEHNAIVRSDAYVAIVKDFVLGPEI